ncbi:MAG: GNAT family N-acetyltransferase [Eubacteriales bacterium]|nr:GNAT family N-acetyltransferase [Eubacteriales bacterium]
MVCADSSDRSKLALLFQGIQDSMVIAYLQGYNGTCYVDRLPDPTFGIIISGEYSFFGGDAKAAQPLLANLSDYIKGSESTAIYSDQSWCNELMKYPQNNPVEVPRHGIVQKDYAFDKDMLSGFASDIPDGFEIKPFDEELYKQAILEDWSAEFVEAFESAQDFLTKGFGEAVVEKSTGKLVAGATTQTVYDSGGETQLATHPDYRGFGLAIAAASAFLLEGQRRGLRICWDAANLTSKHIALKLGYEDAGVYSTVHLSF